MKNMNGEFIPNSTEIKRAKAHTRAIARKRKGQYGGEVECMFDNRTGKFHYFEHVGNGSYTRETEELKYIYSATVYEFN